MAPQPAVGAAVARDGLAVVRNALLLGVVGAEAPEFLVESIGRVLHKLVSESDRASKPIL